jgi:hypothetical protein
MVPHDTGPPRACVCARASLCTDPFVSVCLALCCRVVGPYGNHTYLDGILPPDITLGSIDMNVGRTPVDPAYASIVHHKKLVVPWMEDDPGLTGVQLWVNRTLGHMQDARDYGIDELLGIHWRTRGIAPQISAMAQWSWDTTLTPQAFWADWIATEFGLTPGTDTFEMANAIFNSIDSFFMPVRLPPLHCTALHCQTRPVWLLSAVLTC